MTATDYVNVTTHLGLLDSCGFTAGTFLSQIDTLVAATSVPSTNPTVVQMVGNANATAEAIVNQRYSNTGVALFNAVVAVQQYVIKTYGSVGAMLASQNLKVTSVFATLSSNCGFHIPPAYVGP